MRESFDVWGCDAVQEGPKLAQSELCKSRVAVIASTGNNPCAIGRDPSALDEMPLLPARLHGSGGGLCSCTSVVSALEIGWMLQHGAVLHGEALSPSRYSCSLASWQPTLCSCQRY